MISVAVVGIKNPGNLGAIARVMKNFEVNSLILINSCCDPLSDEAIFRAKHGKDILKKAKIKNFDYLKKFDYIVGTTAKTGSDYNIPRVPLSPQQFAEKVAETDSKVALLIGREDCGLSNDEILKCDFTVTIPSSTKYPTLNISHAVAVLLYEVFKTGYINTKHPPMSKKEKEEIIKKINKILDKMYFSTSEKRETQRRVWKRLIGKAMLTKREAFALLGFLRKLE